MIAQYPGLSTDLFLISFHPRPPTYKKNSLFETLALMELQSPARTNPSSIQWRHESGTSPVLLHVLIDEELLAEKCGRGNRGENAVNEVIWFNSSRGVQFISLRTFTDSFVAVTRETARCVLSHSQTGCRRLKTFFFCHLILQFRNRGCDCSKQDLLV